MKKFFKEFKAFISRGNVIDLAIGMIIGAAFTAIVTSVVTNIFNPLLASLGGAESQALVTELRPAVIEEGVMIKEAIVIDWGAVITAVINFLFTAIVLFLIIKVIAAAQQTAQKTVTKIKKKSKKGEVVEETVEETVVVAPKPTTEELLQHIIELMEGQKNPEVKEIKEVVKSEVE